MSPRPRLRPRSGGFTLIEMMVAMGILVVGVTSVLGLLAFGAALQRTAERRSEVALAAEQVIADLRESFSLQQDGSVAGPAPGASEHPIPGHPNLRARITLEKNPGLEGEYFATIQIQWMERGTLRSENYRTILEREAPFTERVQGERRRAPGR